MRVGFVGLGNMGLPMAKQIAQKHELCFFTRSADKRARLLKQDLKGSTSVDTVEALASDVDAVVAVLNTADTSRMVLLEKILPNARKGTLLIDCATVPQELSLECHEACKSAGCAFIDAPISGGPSRANDGTLSVMVGGDQAAKEAAEAVLQCLGTVYDMGAPGRGTAAKLVNQLLVGVHSVVACEAMLLADKLGIEDKDQLMKLIGNSFGYSKAFERNAPVIAGGDFTSTSQPIRNMVKDMSIISQVIADSGLQLPMTAVAQDLHQEAQRADCLEEDMAVPFRFLKDRTSS